MTDSMNSPRARAIINAATILLISHDELIDALQMMIGESISFPGDLANKERCLNAIASPLYSSDDDFDDLIHEISHELGSTMPCEECDARSECDLCCPCLDA